MLNGIDMTAHQDALEVHTLAPAPERPHSGQLQHAHTQSKLFCAVFMMLHGMVSSAVCRMSVLVP